MTKLEIDQKQFKELIHKLDTLIKLTAASTFHGKLKDGILFLSELSFQNKEIAKILGTTPAYVNKVKYEAKKSKGKKKGKTKTKEENQRTT